MVDRLDKIRIADLLLCGMEIPEVADLVGIDEHEVDEIWSEYLENPLEFDNAIENRTPTRQLWPKDRALLKEAEDG